MTRLPSAILWDLDGTLIDSEPYWMQAESSLAERHGIEWTEERALSLVGVDLWDGAAFFQSLGVPGSADEIVEGLNAVVLDGIRAHIPFRPGALALLDEAHAAGIPQALVTMSISSMADAVVEAMREDLGRDPFLVQVTGDLVERGKPHPDPYLMGAEQLGVDVAQSVVIEDSFPGVRSGVAAGAVVIGVPHAQDIRELQGPAEIWESLDGRSLADVVAVLAARRPR